MVNPFNIALMAVVTLAGVLMWHALSVTSIMWTINITAILVVVSTEVLKLASDDLDYNWVENRKFAFFNLALVVIAVNLSVLFLIRSMG